MIDTIDLCLSHKNAQRYSVSVSNQEQVPFHGRCVPGSKLEQSTFPEELVSRVDHVLLSNHLIDLQQPLPALLRGETPKHISNSVCI